MMKRGAKPIPIEKRFWPKVQKSSQCWEWKATKRDGYGDIWRNGKHYPAHRFSWELHFGEVPKHLYVLHSCDNRACVNPEHLWLGTHLDNMRDMVMKDRAYTGPHPWKSKLTPKQVRYIKNHVFKRGDQTRLAEKLNIPRKTINNIILGRYWKHIGG